MYGFTVYLREPGAIGSLALTDDGSA